MAPLRIKTVGSFDLSELEVRTVSVVWSCFVLCTFLIVRRLRNRSSMPHIERLEPMSAGREKHLDGDIFDAQDPLSEMDRQLLTDLLNPVLSVGSRQSSLLTSGYLAAKAKMTTAEKLAILAPAQVIVEISESPTQDNPVNSNLDQRLHWSRRSSPGPQGSLSRIQTNFTTDYDDFDHPMRSSTLHVASKHDEVQHFCDDHNKRVKWRRRTLIFEKTP